VPRSFCLCAVVDGGRPDHQRSSDSGQSPGAATSGEGLVEPARLELPLLDPQLRRELRVSRRRSSTTRKTQVPRGPCGPPLDRSTEANVGVRLRGQEHMFAESDLERRLTESRSESRRFRP